MLKADTVMWKVDGVMTKTDNIMSGLCALARQTRWIRTRPVSYSQPAATTRRRLRRKSPLRAVIANRQDVLYSATSMSQSALGLDIPATLLGRADQVIE